MNTPRNNMEPQPEREPIDPRLDGLLDEAFSARHMPVPKGMNDRILAAMEQARKTTGGADTDGNEGHVVASIGIIRWSWVGVAAAALFGVSAVLLMQGTPGPSNGVTVPGSTSVSQDGSATINMALLGEDVSRFSELGNTDKDAVDQDLAALSTSIDQLNKMWVTDPAQQTGTGQY